LYLDVRRLSGHSATVFVRYARYLYMYFPITYVRYAYVILPYTLASFYDESKLFVSYLQSKFTKVSIWCVSDSHEQSKKQTGLSCLVIGLVGLRLGSSSSRTGLFMTIYSLQNKISEVDS